MDLKFIFNSVDQSDFSVKLSLNFFYVLSWKKEVRFISGGKAANLHICPNCSTDLSILVVTFSKYSVISTEQAFLTYSVVTFDLLLESVQKYRISPNKCRASIKCRPLLSTKRLPLINTAPENTVLIRNLTII